MANFAELGIKIDSGDAVEAKDNLDKLADAAKRSGDSAGKAGRAWESALSGLQGDTRQIVQELQALNAKQAQTAQLMASVGRAVTSASDSFTSAAKGLNAMRSGADQAGQAQTNLAGSTDASAQSGRKAAETAEQQKDRLLAMAQASLEASTYVQSLNSSLERQATATSQANAVLSDREARQAAINSRAQALLETEERLSRSSKESTESRKAEAAGLQELLGKIDPTVAALGRLDDMESKLQGYRDKKLLDTESFGEYKAKIDQARSALGGMDTAINKTGVSAKQTAAAMRMLPAQFSDVVVSLQGGQAPLTVLLQQGAQVKDSFGGVGAAAKAMGSYIAGLVNPISVAAAGVAVLGVAYYQAGREQDAFNQAIILTGNYANTSGARLTDLARQISSTVGTTGAAASVLARLAGAGDLAGESFKTVAQTALEMEKATGRSVEQTISEFSRIADDPVKAAETLNERYHWLTAATLEQARALVEQGEKTEAVRLITEQFGETMSRRAQLIREEMSGLPKLFDEIGSAASKMWDGIKGVWRAPSLDEVAEKLRLQIRSMQNIRPEFRNEGNYDPEKLKAWQARLDEIVGISKPDKAVVSPEGQGAYKWIQDELDKTAPKADKLKKALEEVDRRVAKARSDGFTVTDAEIVKLKQQEREKFKDPAGRTTPVDLTSVNDQQNALKAIVTSFANNQRELDALQKAGIVSQEAYYHQRVALANSEKEQVTAAYEDQIKALEETKNRSSTTAAQRIQLDQKIADARANMVKAQKDADSELAVLSANEQGRLKTETRAITSYTEALQLQLDTLRQSGARAVAGVGQGGRNRQIAGELNTLDDRYAQDQRTLADQYGDGSRGMSQAEFEKKQAALASNHTAATQQILQNYRDLADAEGNWLNGAQSAFEDYGDRARDIAGQTSDMIYNTMESVTQGIGDNTAEAIVQGKSLEDSMASLGRSIVTDVLSSLIQVGTRYGINTALELAGIATTTSAKVASEGVKTAAEVTGIGVVTGASLAATATTTTAQVAAAGTTLSAWLPAALVASVGTLGAAAIVGGAGLLAAFALFKGFSSGGYTGDGGVNEPAGVVHKGEVVWSQADIKRFGGVASVEALRSGRMTTSGAASASRAVASDRPSSAPAQQGAQVNLYEDASRAGQVQSRTGTDGKQITDLWVSNIRSGGREAKVLEETYGLKRRGR